VENAVKSGGFKDEHMPKTIGSLLFEGLGKDANLVPFSERESIWKIIQNLDSQEYDGSHWEDGYPESNRDAITIAINSAHGDVMHAVIGYAIWCSINLKKSGKRGLVEEVKQVLLKRLDPSFDNTVSTRAVLGMFFTNLFAIEKQRAVENAKTIFGIDNQKLAKAAMEGYLCNQVYRDVFSEMIPYYQKHVLEAAQDKEGDRLSEHQEQLVDHIVIAYLLNHDCADALFIQFKSIANEKMLDHAIWRVGFELRHYKGGETKINLEKIKRMWRDEKFQSRPDLAEWFVHSPFDYKFTISAFLGNLQKSKGKTYHIHSTSEHLAKYAKGFPEETMLCLEQLVSGYPQGWEIYSMREKIKQMIADIKSSGDNRLIESANKMINHLGSLGFDEFRSLL
jgi:hypothetical protein